MPFKSNAQRRYMYAKHPAIAKRFSEEAKREGVAGKKLPEHVKRKKRK